MKKIITGILICLLAFMCVPEVAEAAKVPKPLKKVCSKSEWEVLEIVNQKRNKEGLAPLMMNDLLQKASGIRTKEIETLFDHTRPDGSRCFTALEEAGVSYMAAGENIATGFSSPKDVMYGWMHSPGHRANILSTSFTRIGIGCSDEAYGSDWVQMFTGITVPNTIKVNKSSEILTYKRGTNISQMNRFVIGECSDGVCYMPLAKFMCKGYKKMKTGVQTITVRAYDLETTFQVEIVD